MKLHPQLAQKRIDNAVGDVKAISEVRQQENAENRRTYERFYNNLALFASGTVALSVTYLGYLKTLDSQPSAEYLLVGSWTCLFGCLCTSLFWSYFNTHYVHYARDREYSEAKREQREAEADGISSVNVVNLTAKELGEFQDRLRETAQKWENKAAQIKTKEDRYLQIWQLFGVVARISFLFGIALLLIFAIKNI